MPDSLRNQKRFIKMKPFTAEPFLETLYRKLFTQIAHEALMRFGCRSVHIECKIVIWKRVWIGLRPKIRKICVCCTTSRKGHGMLGNDQTRCRACLPIGMFKVTNASK